MVRSTSASAIPLTSYPAASAPRAADGRQLVPRIAFLLGTVEMARNDNHVRLPRAFAEAGWEVDELPQNGVALTPEGVRFGDRDPDRFDLVWVLGLGRADTFYDRAQLLRLLPQERFVTEIDALVYLHAKYAWWPYMPETYASNEAPRLCALLESGGEWVVKPAAGSYGRDVYRVRAGAEDAALIAELVGDATQPGRYCLLQRFVDQIAAGEKRTLIAGGQVLGSYLRVPDGDFRANLAVGATPEATRLTGTEQDLVQEIADQLTRRGVGFAAIDTCHPYLMEVNVANPGGLETLGRLYGRDVTAEAVAAIARSVKTRVG
jgi:glutathione synthase